jgi:hypothetical protein
MRPSHRVRPDTEKLAAVASILKDASLPGEMESADHTFPWDQSAEDLANAYCAIVAICHQTSPVGERRLEGRIDGVALFGWDYLKARFLMSANADIRWTQPAYWRDLSPVDLSQLYDDAVFGLTLSRVNERAFLLNQLGQRLVDDDANYISEPFLRSGSRLAGGDGFLNYLASIVPFSDPVMKKSFFFLSIAQKECGWKIADAEALKSPVDYHEMRGHLRIGTVSILDQRLLDKVQRALPLDESEDAELRSVIQAANEELAASSGVTSSVIHYLLWNVFRNCCPRPSNKTHCTICVNCQLPPQYKEMKIYDGRCVFSPVCNSANRPDKVIEPPYIGHYY